MLMSTDNGVACLRTYADAELQTLSNGTACLCIYADGEVLTWLKS